MSSGKLSCRGAYVIIKVKYNHGQLFFSGKFTKLRDGYGKSLGHIILR